MQLVKKITTPMKGTRRWVKGQSLKFRCEVKWPRIKFVSCMSHCVFRSPYNTLQVYRLPVANISPKENEVVWWWGGDTLVSSTLYYQSIFKTIWFCACDCLHEFLQSVINWVHRKRLHHIWTGPISYDSLSYTAWTASCCILLKMRYTICIYF